MSALSRRLSSHLLACAACALGAFCLLPAIALAQQPVTYKLAATIAPGDTWRYAITDRRDLAPPVPADTLDAQTMPQERFADHPHAFVRAGLNARLEQEYEGKPLVEKHFAGQTMEMRLFEVQLIRDYPRNTNYASAGAGQGLLGVLVGAIMDGMASRNAMRKMVTVRVILIIGGKPVETNSRRAYTDETLQAELIDCAEAALHSLALQLIDAARDMEKEATQAQNAQGGEAVAAPGTAPPPAAASLPETATATK